MLLKAILSDGHYTTEDFIMVGCFDQYPTPTPTITPTNGTVSTPLPSFPTPTPTQSANGVPISSINLQQSNNWTYRYNDALIIRFIPVTQPSDIVVTIPSLMVELLPLPGQPAPIPLSATVLRQSDKIGDLLFISPYINKNINITINNNSYNSIISMGQILF
jgi:hypothetical protein